MVGITGAKHEDGFEISILFTRSLIIFSVSK